MKPVSEISTNDLILEDKEIWDRLPSAPDFPLRLRRVLSIRRREIHAELEKRQAIARNLAALDDECEKIDYFIDLVYDD
jgi:hypothetical protein